MSYFEAYETGAFHYSNGVKYASTLLLHDIAAVQRLYGANMTARTGDTIYGFNSTAGLDSYDFTKNQAPVIAIWDAGGAHDVLDASGYAFNQVIDLHAGAFSNIGGMRLNVAIAEGTTIEDAVGGSLDDTMTGNAGANILTGNGGWDTISGLDGDDTLNGNDGNDNLNGGDGKDLLSGGAGNDTLTGGTGGDQLNGGAGDDTTTGGDGNDTYFVDSDLDYAIESNAVLGSGGDDLVVSGVSYWLGDNFERLTLSGTAAIAAIGNGLANALTGNSAANVLNGYGGNDSLNGGGGADVMNGGDGSDIYYIDNGADKAIESNAALASGGSDLVVSTVTFALGANVERMTLSGAAAIGGTGNALANQLTGNSGANTLAGLGGNDVISGGAGNDTIKGGLGNDWLTGGAGRDVFVFDTVLRPSANRDTIKDFSSADDTIKLENAVFTGLGTSIGALAAAKFWASAQGVAHDASDRIIYNKSTGVLSYDADGNGKGAAIQFALLENHAPLNIGDFIVI